MMKQVIYLSIRELANLIRNKEISPVDLANTFLARIENLGPRYNAVVSLTRDRAIKQARKAEEEILKGNYRGKLHGIPFGAKDLLATNGNIPTTWGAEPLRNQIFNYDATVIRNLEAAGAVLSAKLAMVELAGGMGYRQPNAAFTGPGISPWGNGMAWSGGSSSGSGSAVGAGLVPFAIGSETWGSILGPANNCGVSGLRPTYGRVSRYGAMALCWTLDKLGPLCLNADDCGLVLEAIAGHDSNDPTTSRQKYQYDAGDGNSRKFRIGVIRDVTEGTDEAVRKNFLESLKSLEDIATIEEINLPELPYEAVTRTILFAEASSAFEDFIDSGKNMQLTAPEDRFGGYAGLTILAKDYIRALRIRGMIAKIVDQAFEDFDVLVGPSRPSVAPSIEGEFRSVIRAGAKDLMGAIGNGVGLPAISVPNGFSDAGLPTGIQFMGRAYAENTVLQIASSYQSLTKWHEYHPEQLA